MPIRRIPMVLSLALLGGCSPLVLLNALSDSSHYELYADVPYGEGERRTLDVFRPVDSRPDAPLVVYFYGRAWRDGHKEEFRFVANSLTRAGFVVMLPDYRLYPEIRFPEYVEDGAAAVAWAVDNAARFGADRHRLYLMGHSAGAHIASLLSFDRRYLERAGSASTKIAGFIGLSGPYDFLPIEHEYLVELFPEDTRADSQPIRFVSADSPPTLLIHGGDDDVVESGNSERLAERMRALGAPVTLRNYEGVGHGRVVVALAPPLDFIAATLDDCIDFIEAIEARRRPVAQY